MNPLSDLSTHANGNPSESLEDSSNDLGYSQDTRITPIATDSIPPELATIAEDDKEKLVADKAKAFLPQCKLFWELADSIRVETVCAVARQNGWKKDEIKELDKRISSSDEVVGMGAMSSARLCARRVKNPETLDWSGIVAAITAMGSSTITAIREIRANPQPKSAPLPKQ